MDNIYAASPAVALVSAIAIQILKRSRSFSWISRDTAKINAAVSGIVATLTGLGLAMTFDWNPETGKFAAGFSGNAYDLMHVLLHAPVQWAEQHGIYKLFIALPEAAGETRDYQKKILEMMENSKIKKELTAAATTTDLSGVKLEE